MIRLRGPNARSSSADRWQPPSMCEQPISTVDEADVARDIRRDFAATMRPPARRELAALRDGCSPRVQLAVLKLANGDLNALAECVAWGRRSARPAQCSYQPMMVR